MTPNQSRRHHSPKGNRWCVDALNKELGKRGFQISNGYGSLKDKTFRIAHMADCQMEDIQELLSNINDILGLE